VRNKFLSLRTRYGGVPRFVSVFGGGTVVLAALIYLAVRIGYRFYLKAIERELKNRKIDEESFPLIAKQQQQQAESSNKGEAAAKSNDENEDEKDDENEDAAADLIAPTPLVPNDSVLFNDDDDDNATMTTTALSETTKNQSSMDDNAKQLHKQQLSEEEQRKAELMENSMPAQRFFIVRLPGLTFIGIQVYLLMQSFYLAMMTMHFSYVITIEPVISDFIPFRWAYLAVCYIPSFLICLVFFPMTIPLFTILYSVESFRRTDIVDKLENASAMHNHHQHVSHGSGKSKHGGNHNNEHHHQSIRFSHAQHH